MSVLLRKASEQMGGSEKDAFQVDMGNLALMAKPLNHLLLVPMSQIPAKMVRLLCGVIAGLFAVDSQSIIS